MNSLVKQNNEYVLICDHGRYIFDSAQAAFDYIAVACLGVVFDVIIHPFGASASKR